LPLLKFQPSYDPLMIYDMIH